MFLHVLPLVLKTLKTPHVRHGHSIPSNPQLDSFGKKSMWEPLFSFKCAPSKCLPEAVGGPPLFTINFQALPHNESHIHTVVRELKSCCGASAPTTRLSKPHAYHRKLTIYFARPIHSGAGESYHQSCLLNRR